VAGPSSRLAVNLTFLASVHSQVTRSLLTERSQSLATIGSVADENLLGLSLRKRASLSTRGGGGGGGGGGLLLLLLLALALMNCVIICMSCACVVANC
jgi:hypothetical protein